MGQESYGVINVKYILYEDVCRENIITRSIIVLGMILNMFQRHFYAETLFQAQNLISGHGFNNM